MFTRARDEWDRNCFEALRRRLAGTNIVFARELSRVNIYPQFPSSLPSTLSSQYYRDYRSHALEVIGVSCFLTTALQLVALQQAQSAAFKYSGA